ncbi:hypothetical protein LXL04_008997 [Taraxacum kok-saghyz]
MDAVDRHRYRCQREINPSFSSTLLDKIYRSIEERDDDDDDDESVVCRGTLRKRQSIDGCFQVDGSVRRSGGSKNVSEMAVGRKSVAGFENSSRRSEGNTNLGSSCYRYSSSEAETIYGFPARPRPIRTRTNEYDANECNTREKQPSMYAQKHQSEDLLPKSKRQGRFGKTKSGAMKMYGYLKKGKRPISPGGRLATFLISLFTTGNAKKSFCTGGDGEAIINAKRETKSANASMPSSASSFTRSCLSKTPSLSRGKLNTDLKRSVSFYPGTVIVDEYRQPRGRKLLHVDGSDSLAVQFARNSVNEEIQKHMTEKNFRTEETTRNLINNYQKKIKYAFDSSKSSVTGNEGYYDGEDDSASYASSDLFELDHLSAIGIDRCMQELPLYETTSVVVNRAIANGLLV